MYWQPGHKLNHQQYTIETMLGQGAFGVTYKAVNSRINLPVVIKTPNPTLQRDRNYSRFVSKFIQEAQLLGQLCTNPHPNIVRVIDYFDEGNNIPCLVMEYIAGNNLFELIEPQNGTPKPLPENVAVNYIRQIGDALISMHENSTVHRDIHPGNLMIRSNQQPMLIDFGLAGDITPATSFSRSFGNQNFAPYEQFTGNKEPTVDIYGLAATLYYAVTGEYPASSWDRKYHQAELIEPQQYVSSLSKSCCDAILQGMALEAKERSQTMQEWLDYLTPNPSPYQREGSLNPSLKTWQFEVVKVDVTGKITNRPNCEAKYLVEDLGNGVTLEIVQIPGGTFKMGSSVKEAGRYESESPQHRVTVPGFFMGKYQVTQAQYQAVMGNNPSNFKGEKRPVEQVSWDDAVEFCQKISQKIGRTYRLPSEAEWEYACRAGTTTPFYFGETITTELANYRGTDWDYEGTVYPGNYSQGPKGKFCEETTPVGSFPANAFGLYDMHGNVWEWCQDSWHENYNDAPTNGNAWIDNDNDNKMLRGGSWYGRPENCRSAFRFDNTRANPNVDVGFRVVVVVA